MKNYLRERITTCLQAMGINGGLTPTFEKPRAAEHGDLTTNIAMIAAKKMKMAPRVLAQQIVEHARIERKYIDRMEVAGPGFINFHFANNYYYEELAAILRKGGTFGRSDAGGGRKTQVEFVSANPTGPLTVGHGRGAVYGDTIARLLEWTNHAVTREYYFNNAGRQMRILGDSVRRRYLELLGGTEEFPEDYYQGEYIKDIARHLFDSRGDALRDEPAEGIFKRQAEQEIFDDIKKTLARLGIVHDVFYNENTLYEEGKVAAVIEEFRKKDMAYDADGATWFRATKFGSEKDKVIVKNTGEPTYRLPDIAYHREKIRRGFSQIIDVLGADHIATYPDVLAGLEALGEDSKGIKVLIHQFVTITQEGEVVKMSTRKANFVTLDELIDETGADVVRYFFLMRGIGSHLNFDLKLAKDHSEENPVYYLQYAHARIASILRHAEGQNIDTNAGADLSLLTQAEEVDLIKLLVDFPAMVESCAATYEPHRLVEYLHDVAGGFHKFYHEHQVVSREESDRNITMARLALCRAAKIVLANGFNVLGISAPEKM